MYLRHDKIPAVFKCDLCPKRFTRAEVLSTPQLRAHLKSENPDYVCEQCGKSFVRNYELVRHQSQHQSIHSLPIQDDSNNNVTGNFDKYAIPQQQHSAVDQQAITELDENEIHRSSLLEPNKTWFCQHPSRSCWKNGKTRQFSRKDDLTRHTEHARPQPGARPPGSMICDYPTCDQLAEPFSRKDHYRDHYVEMHGEDLRSPGSFR
jgi:hypothetical protein